MVDRLWKAGQVERLPHPKDRRSLLVTLTFRGEETMSGIDALYTDTIASLIEASPTAQAQLIELLQKVADAVDQVSPATLQIHLRS